MGGMQMSVSMGFPPSTPEGLLRTALMAYGITNPVRFDQGTLLPPKVRVMLDETNWVSAEYLDRDPTIVAIYLRTKIAEHQWTIRRAYNRANNILDMMVAA